MWGPCREAAAEKPVVLWPWKPASLDFLKGNHSWLTFWRCQSCNESAQELAPMEARRGGRLQAPCFGTECKLKGCPWEGPWQVWDLRPWRKPLPHWMWP